MALDATDWSVDRATGNIRYIGDDHGGASPSYSAVIELHRWLADLSDDASSAGDDELDRTDEVASDRSTDNIIKLLGSYNIDDNAAEHLYNGSITQGAGGTEVIYEGIINFGNAGVVMQIHQDGAVLADDWWNSNSGLNADAANGVSHRFLLKVRSAGADIDGRRLIGTCRTFGNNYGEFSINGTSRGNNVLALSDSSDLNNQTLITTIATIADISNIEGYRSIDVDNDTTAENYYSEWDIGANSINTFYERMKWLTRDGSGSTIYGLNGELFRGITHELTVDTPTGTFLSVESVSWSGGTGQMFAINSTTAGTKMWIQLLTGVAPTDGQVITGVTSTATVTINVTVTARTLSYPFVGQSTGSALIGSYGFGVEASDLSASDKVTDLTDTLITPPNNVTFTVAGLVVSEDSIVVAPWDGVSVDAEGNPAIDKNQMALNGALTTAGVTAIVVSGSIPADTPASGTIRIELDTGAYRLVNYSSFSGSAFTIASTDFSGANSAATANNVWISYLDLVATASSESFSVVYNVDRNLVVMVRDGGVTPIKPFITSASITSSGGAVTAIRTSDA